jgi:hypothetical protein
VSKAKTYNEADESVPGLGASVTCGSPAAMPNESMPPALESPPPDVGACSSEGASDEAEGEPVPADEDLLRYLFTIC